jgi:hypothetical protein
LPSSRDGAKEHGVAFEDDLGAVAFDIVRQVHRFDGGDRVWLQALAKQDIAYPIHGDVRRALSLQVGNGINPQFLFSSGQRRATGLAFLLSITLSLAWSR